MVKEKMTFLKRVFLTHTTPVDICMAVGFVSAAVWLHSSGIPFRSMAGWILFWIFLYAGVSRTISKHGRAAGIAFGLAVAAAIVFYLCFPSKDTALYMVVSCAACLFLIWPLRFLALGELSFALIFGYGFWYGCLSLLPEIGGGNMAGHYSEPFRALAAGSTLCLFLQGTAFTLWQYPRHKSLQHYSLPVTIGWLFPSIGGRIEGMRKRKYRNLVFSYAITLAFILYGAICRAKW